MRDFEKEAKAARLSGEIRALEIQIEALRSQLDESGNAASTQRDHFGEFRFLSRSAPNQLRNYRSTRRDECPGGCDTAVGGCIIHADRC